MCGGTHILGLKVEVRTGFRLRLKSGWDWGLVGALRVQVRSS